MCVIRRHFRWVRADSRGSIFSRNTVARRVGPSSQGKTFFSRNTGGPSGGSLLSGGGIIIFRVIRRHFLRLPWTQLSASPCTVLFRWKLGVDHVDHAALRAPGQWTTARTRKGSTQSWGRLGSGCPRGGEYEGLLVRLPSLENNRRCG